MRHALVNIRTLSVFALLVLGGCGGSAADGDAGGSGGVGGAAGVGGAGGEPNDGLWDQMSWTTGHWE